MCQIGSYGKFAPDTMVRDCIRERVTILGVFFFPSERKSFTTVVTGLDHFHIPAQTSLFRGSSQGLIG